MSQEAEIPDRFQAVTLPGDGLVKITDTTTGRSGNIRLKCFQSVTSLLCDLFPSDLEASPDVAVEAASVEQAPVKRKRGRPKSSAAKPAEGKAQAEDAAPELPLEAAAPPLAAKKPAAKKPRKKAAAKVVPQPVPAEDLEAEIPDDGYKLVLVKSTPHPVYEIHTDQEEVIGTVELLAANKVEVTPNSGATFSSSTHKSLLAAQARICVLVD